MHGKITHKDYELEYFVYGKGEKTAFAFHGFNNHAVDFRPLEDELGDIYKIVSINLFFHGTSHAHVGIVEKGFSVNDLKDLYKNLSGIFSAEKYTLIGYSLGGRIVLKLLEIIPEKIERIILLAPDGIKISPFYKFLTQTQIGKNVLADVVRDPSTFHFVAKILRNVRLVSEKKYQFAVGNFDTDQKRKKVFLVWMTFRKVFSDAQNLKKIIARFKIPVHLFFGRYDKIIPPAIGLKYRKGFEKLITLDIIDAGHKLLREKNLHEIGRRIRQIKNDAG